MSWTDDLPWNTSWLREHLRSLNPDYAKHDIQGIMKHVDEIIKYANDVSQPDSPKGVRSCPMREQVQLAFLDPVCLISKVQLTICRNKKGIV